MGFESSLANFTDNHKYRSTEKEISEKFREQILVRKTLDFQVGTARKGLGNKTLNRKEKKQRLEL